MKFFLTLLLVVPFSLLAQDTIPPVISNFWNDGDSIQVFSNYNNQIPAYKVMDDVDGDITSSALLSNTVNSGILGTYTASITAKDKAGNTTTESVTIKVIDTIAPTLTLNGDNPICIPAGYDYTDAGFTVSDNYWPGPQITVVVSGNYVNEANRGWYCVSFTAYDSLGNASNTEYRSIYVDLIDSGETCSFISGKVCGKDPLSIVPYKAPQLEVYPNPSNGLVQLHADYLLERVEAYSISGQRAMSNTINANHFELSLPKKGLYYLMIYSEKGLVKKLVVVE